LLLSVEEVASVVAAAGMSSMSIIPSPISLAS